jgi:hypothetical protein
MNSKLYLNGRDWEILGESPVPLLKKTLKA